MRVVETKKGDPATVAQIAAFEFAAIKCFRGMSKVQRLKKIHTFADNVRAMAVIAVEIVNNDKDALIAKVEDKYDLFGPFLMQLAHAKDDARALMETIGAAEIRLAVVLANVEGDEAQEAVL